MNLKFKKNGGEEIQSLIDRAKADGTNRVVITGAWEIEREIRIPSDFHVILDNAHLRLADGVFCNVFINEHCRTEIGHTLAGRDRNITVEGRGNAVIDGGNHNGLLERTSEKNGMPHISYNNLLLFTNVDGFRVNGIRFINQRWWALDFIYCANGRISNIDFLANYSVRNENTGEIIPFSSIKDITGVSNNSVCVPNADGIDLRAGCHNIIIENITGYTEDDTVALTNLPGDIEELYKVEGLSTDLHDVIIRNVNSSALCSNVRLLNQGGTKLYNILIDGVFDSSMNSPYMDRGYCGVRVGDRDMYGKTHSTAEETYNIRITNVYSRALTVLRLIGGMKNVTYDNINGFDGYQYLTDIQILE